MKEYFDALEQVNSTQFHGKVDSVKGLVVACKGLGTVFKVGDRCLIERKRHTNLNNDFIKAEVVGFGSDVALLMPFEQLDGIGQGSKVIVEDASPAIMPNHGWLGRVVNAFGEPIDGKGALPRGDVPYLIRGTPMQSHMRERVRGKMDMGVRAINSFLTCCRGQRMGIFAGSGVGKSVLMSMLARYSQADVNVIGLIGERGREVQEFIEDNLGEEGLKRSVVVVATSSEAALMRREAAYLTMALCEYFRDSGKDVLCLMDSVTRFAMAQREIGLSVGEPPTTKGYTPTVFAELPRLLERAGTGMKGQGAITAFFTVLVEGDDTNEPIADTVRGILDGHIVMDRAIAERGRFPAINILRSVSRTMPDCNSNAETSLVMMARQMLTTYDDMAEMVRLGAYRKGTDAEVDRAIHYYQPLEKFLTQNKNDCTNLADSYAKLAQAMDISPWPLV